MKSVYIIIVGSVVAGSVIFYLWHLHISILSTPLASPIHGPSITVQIAQSSPAPSNTVTSFNYSDTDLTPLVEKDLDGAGGDYGIVIESLPNQVDTSNTPNTRYYLHQDQVFTAASVYKVFLIASVMQAEHDGTLTDDTVLDASTDHLISVLGSSEYGYDPSQTEIEYTVSDALGRVARISDNYAAIMLAEKVGWNAVQQAANDAGAIDTDITAYPVTTTPNDVATFFEKLYSKQIVSEDASERIIQLLETDTVNDRIPAGVPAGIPIAHKDGELDDVRNDAGIVFLDHHPYIIVMFAQNLDNVATSTQIEAQISHDVFSYFNSLSAS